MKNKSTVRQIERKPAETRTPEEAERLRALWRDKKRRARAVAPDMSGTLLVLLNEAGTGGVLQALERALLSRAGDEPSARVREQILEETRLVSRLVGTLTEPSEPQLSAQ